jgi:hypothetical protein
MTAAGGDFGEDASPAELGERHRWQLVLRRHVSWKVKIVPLFGK